MYRNVLELAGLEHVGVVLGDIVGERVDLITGGVVTDLIDHLTALFNRSHNPVCRLFRRLAVVSSRSLMLSK